MCVLVLCCLFCFKQKTKYRTQNHELREEIKSSFFSRISQLISYSTTYTHTTHTAKGLIRIWQHVIYIRITKWQHVCSHRHRSTCYTRKSIWKTRSSQNNMSKQHCNTPQIRFTKHGGFRRQSSQSFFNIADGGKVIAYPAPPHLSLGETAAAPSLRRFGWCFSP